MNDVSQQVNHLHTLLNKQTIIINVFDGTFLVTPLLLPLPLYYIY